MQADTGGGGKSLVDRDKNSKLISYINISTGNYNKRLKAISRITIHQMFGDYTLDMVSQILKLGKPCSWNYAIDSDGNIGLFVEESNRAWSSNDEENDELAINILVANSTVAPKWEVSDKAYQSLLNLCEDICRRDNINRLTYTGELRGSNLTMHQWFADTDCPGEYLKNKFSDIANSVNERLKSPNKLKYIQNPDDVTTTYDAAVAGGWNLQVPTADDLNPFVATIDRNTQSLDVNLLKKCGVVGVIVEAGRLFDVVHNKQKYRNPKLASQIKQLTDADMPYGLYADVCARNLAEAKEELYELRFIARAYPPMIGMWLRLFFTKAATVNNLILKTYVEALNSWGFDGRIGIYATKDQLEKISWKEEWCDRVYLWLDDHLETLDDLDELLTPTLFSV